MRWETPTDVAIALFMLACCVLLFNGYVSISELVKKRSAVVGETKKKAK
jgi:hypothetical protein